MWMYRVAGLLGAGGVLLLSSVAQAQCTRDTECKGNRVCEARVCTTSSTLAEEPDAEPAAPPVKGERHSTGMMVGGIVMVSFAPIALLTSLVANMEKSSCEMSSVYGPSLGDCDRYDPTIIGGLVAAGALTAIGIPLIVIGARREPAAVASVTPWTTPHGGGLGLRVDL
jgi:hypothetical protein